MPNNKADLKRRAFLKKGLAGLAAFGAVPPVLKSSSTGRTGAARPGPQGQPGPIVRTLGKTGLKIPVVSMGVMNADNPNLVREALDSGIVMLDTAHSYQRGRNETMIGEVLKGRPRDSYMIATKVSGANREKAMRDQSAETQVKIFLDNFDLSLQRLGLDHVEILYIHGVDQREHVLSEPMLQALRRARESGKARFVGVSTHSNQALVIRAAIESKFHDVVLASYNFRQDYREDLGQAIAEAARAGLGIVAMKTQAGAFWDKEKQEPINMRAALKWALNNPGVTTAIPGFTTFDQLKEDLTVMTDITMTDQEIKDLRLREAVPGLYCQQCGQCEPGCAQGLPIPSLMRSYMYAYGYRNLHAAHELLTSLELPESPCGSCSSCSARCAKGFDLSARVKDIVRLRAVSGDFFA